MSDYNKQTVANLRQLLKDRSIPSTGLTRKAQIVEKLEEWDASQAEGEAESAQPEDATTDEQAATTEDAGVEAGTDSPVRDENESGASDDGAVASVLAEVPEVAAEAMEPAPEAAEPALEQPEAATEVTVPAIEEPEPATEALEPPQTSTTSVADFAKPDRTPSPAQDEKPSIEKQELLPVPEQSTPTTADPSRLNTEELEADTKKRKRRSQTPELTTQDIKAKKPRPSDNATAQDEDVVMDQRAPEEEEKELDEKAMDEAVNGHQDDSIPKDDVEPSTLRAEDEKKEKAPRYRELFKPAEEASPQATTADDRPIAAALHPATPAIYIRNFMRPLRPEALRTHLIFLASPPSSDPDPNILTTLFLDNLKTHALVRFTSTTAASRVRTSLHGIPWPPEANRKDLWVDFVPEDACADWITEEEDAMAAEKEARAAGRPIPAKKFEVVYPENADGGFKAVFQEVDAHAFNPPTGPRRASQQQHSHQQSHQHAAAPAPTQESRHDMEKSFETLKSMFSVTTAKPALYFMPVSDARADLRRRDLDAETSRDWVPEERRKGRGMQQASWRDQKFRFAFDDDDCVAFAGPDFGAWSERSGPGGRGGRGGGFRGRGRGDRGGGGGAWRSEAFGR